MSMYALFPSFSRRWANLSPKVQDLLHSTVDHTPHPTDPSLRQFVTDTISGYPPSEDARTCVGVIRNMGKVRKVYAASKIILKEMDPSLVQAARNHTKAQKRRKILLDYLETHWKDAGLHYAAEFQAEDMGQNVLESLKAVTGLAIASGTPLSSLWEPGGPLRMAVDEVSPPRLTRSVAERAVAMAKRVMSAPTDTGIDAVSTPAGTSSTKRDPVPRGHLSVAPRILLSPEVEVVRNSNESVASHYEHSLCGYETAESPLSAPVASCSSIEDINVHSDDLFPEPPFHETIDLDNNFYHTAPSDDEEAEAELEPSGFNSASTSLATDLAKKVSAELSSMVWLSDGVLWVLTQAFMHITAPQSVLAGRGIFVVDTF
ncbi:uncharacterized protein GLRG_11654 [Colletotrichum graminicola M1.001]|uniref:Uncharacterized protein n=1 Tax=Colletotrichum graminicola (strain M1.001 / M2 / FGSC 10212) TaxID=645133 RepID=E3R071_COLGM|nr:uncharacterized protein GLRG_11654 [Colletotrichum graminicola M1.001]EFQ36509.1 hypothetical protein GLRG_11654 [Colletotrichum graminicola M1.001]